MFYLSPFYHLVFPLTHLIVMDTDTELKFNVELLYKQFSRFWRCIDFQQILNDFETNSGTDSFGGYCISGTMNLVKNITLI